MSIAIASGIFVASAAGLAYIVFTKMSRLLSFPASPPGSNGNVVRNIARSIANSKVAKSIASPEVFLQTVLSKIRIFALRIERKTAEWLAHLRKRSQEKNGSNKFSENYWDKIKK